MAELNYGNAQGWKQLYREILKSALRSATPQQRIEILARERAALIKRDAPSTDETNLQKRIRGVFDLEDLTEEIVNLALSSEPPSWPLPPPNATHAQPKEQEASTADAPQIPDKQAPWLGPEDKAATAARLREFQEDVRRTRQEHSVGQAYRFLGVTAPEPEASPEPAPEKKADDSAEGGRNENRRTKDHRRGPRTDYDTALRVAEIIASVAVDWREKFADVCGALDREEIPYPKTWPRRELALKSWEDAACLEPSLAKKAIRHHLKLANRRKEETFS